MTKLSVVAAVATTVALVATSTDAMYLPGVQPEKYFRGDDVRLNVNKLTSFKTQLPYEYYKLPFCPPENIESRPENLGQILTGNVIESSPFSIQFLEETQCKVLCRKKYTEKEVKAFQDKINEDYLVNWIVDNLPAVSKVAHANGVQPYFRGFPVGGMILQEGENAKNLYFLNNHVEITIKHHVLDYDDDASASYIVGFEVEPYSVKHKYKGKWSADTQLKTCDDLSHTFDGKYSQIIDGPTEVIWSYSVTYKEEPEIRWASRWDVYLSMGQGGGAAKVHWFSIVNSLLIVFFLTGMVAMIMFRTLHRDLSRYNRVPTEEEKAEDREETGWKLIHGDVFRPPENPLLFSVTVGSGVQVLCMSFATIIFSAIGFLSPARRGSLMNALLLLFAFFGVAAGYNAARTYKMFNGKEWRSCTLSTAFLYPGIIFALMFCLNLVVWIEGSSAAIPFTSMLAILILWFCISVPLTFLGAYFGYKRDVDKQPVATQDVPRAIPEQPWYMHPFLTIAIGGILPFGAVFVELYFILSSIWMDQYYYVFGFLMIVFLILFFTCAEITLVLCYFQLCGEDYHWWWRSLVTSGASAIYLFFYSLFYFSTGLQMDMFAALLLFFGYTLIISIIFFLATGCIGYFACLWFVYKIYGAVKVD